MTGMGFVGLSTAVHFATQGFSVIASSKEKQKVSMIRNGEAPFYEPELERLLRRVLNNKKLKVIFGREEAILHSDVTFIAVGTPSLTDGSADLNFIKTTAREIGLAMKKKKSYHLVVVKSTVPPRTTGNILRPIIEQSSGKKAGKEFGLAMSPEFLREGTAMNDVANPDRVVIGEFDKRSGDVLERLNKDLYGVKVPILRMSLAAAELAKYASNAFLATKISFINQMANLCERISGVDVGDVARAMGLDPRIGAQFLRAGAGWGGSCFPKDTKALVALSKELGYESGLIKEVISVNMMQAKRMVEIAEEELIDLGGRRIAILGLSFKPDTDDIREAASTRIIELLLSKAAKAKVYDPVAMDKVKEIFGSRIKYSTDAQGCLKDADCCLVVTEWDQFKQLKARDFANAMRRPVVIDGRRIYNPSEFSKVLTYRAIGLCKSSGRKKLSEKR